MIESYIERWDLAKERYRVSILRDGTTLEWCETTSDGCTTGRGATLKDAAMPTAVLGLIATFIGEGYELGAHEVYDPGQLLAYLKDLEPADTPDIAVTEKAKGALTYLRPFLGLSDDLPDRSKQDAPVQVWALRALLREREQLVNSYFVMRHQRDTMLEGFDEATAESKQLRRQLDAAEAQPADREQLLALIDALTDDSDCWFDHNGMCQGHGVSLDPGQRCPHAEAKELLAARPGPLESAVTEALADIATTPADPEPAPIRHAWLIEAGDD